MRAAPTDAIVNLELFHGIYGNVASRRHPRSISIDIFDDLNCFDWLVSGDTLQITLGDKFLSKCCNLDDVDESSFTLDLTM